MKNPRGQVFAILNARNLTRPERLAVLGYIATRKVGSLNDLNARELEHVAAIIHAFDVNYIDARRTAARIVDLLAADKRIAERLDGAK